MPHFLYNVGRLITYLSLGVLAALIGRTLDSISPIGNIAALVVGIGLVGAGFIQISFGRAFFLSDWAEKLAKALQPIARPLVRGKFPLKPLCIGIVTTLLPCGWLYTFVALAAASANMWTAIFIMATFWLGTLPIMLSVGLFSQAITSKLGKVRPTLVAILLILGGFASITFHLQHSNHAHHTHHPE